MRCSGHRRLELLRRCDQLPRLDRPPRQRALELDVLRLDRSRVQLALEAPDPALLTRACCLAPLRHVGVASDHTTAFAVRVGGFPGAPYPPGTLRATDVIPKCADSDQQPAIRLITSQNMAILTGRLFSLFPLSQS